MNECLTVSWRWERGGVAAAWGSARTPRGCSPRTRCRRCQRIGGRRTRQGAEPTQSCTGATPSTLWAPRRRRRAAGPPPPTAPSLGGEDDLDTESQGQGLFQAWKYPFLNPMTFPGFPWPYEPCIVQHLIKCSPQTGWIRSLTPLHRHICKLWFLGGLQWLPGLFVFPSHSTRKQILKCYAVPLIPQCCVFSSWTCTQPKKEKST